MTQSQAPDAGANGSDVESTSGKTGSPDATNLDASTAGSTRRHRLRNRIPRISLRRKHIVQAQGPDASADTGEANQDDDLGGDLPQSVAAGGEDDWSELKGEPVEDSPGAEMTAKCQPTRMRTFSIVGLSVISLLVGTGAAYFKYVDNSARAAEHAATESTQVAKDDVVALLTYTPDTAEAKLTAVSDRLTGTFRDSYKSLVSNVVIPGAKEKKISAVATAAAAAPISARENHAVVVVFVNQSIVVGHDAPTDTASVVEVTLDKLGDRWLVSGFEPK